jgi:hypothetical protein
MHKGVYFEPVISRAIHKGFWYGKSVHLCHKDYSLLICQSVNISFTTTTILITTFKGFDLHLGKGTSSLDRLVSYAIFFSGIFLIQLLFSLLVLLEFLDGSQLDSST